MLKTQYHGNIPTRIDKFLVNFLQDVSREHIQELIKNNLVFKNGIVVSKPKVLVSLGDIIEIYKLEIKQELFSKDENFLEDISKNIKIIFENKDFIIVDKPAGLLVHKTNNPSSYSLVDFLLSKYPRIRNVVDFNQSQEAILQNRYGIVHRIDKDTSGLLLVALNQKSLMILKQLFKDRQVHKEYICLIRGCIKNIHGHIKYPIVRSRLDHTKRLSVVNTKQSQKTQRTAHTEYWVLERYKDSTLLKVVIHTGRTHQIRVHLQSIGHPIVGDKLYGGKLEYRDKNSLNRQFLHASKLKFEYLGKEYEFLSNLPNDLVLYKSTKTNLSIVIE